MLYLLLPIDSEGCNFEDADHGSEEAAAEELHAAAPGAEGSLGGSDVVLGVSILDDDHLGLGLHYHGLLVVGPAALVGVDCYYLLVVAVPVVHSDDQQYILSIHSNIMFQNIALEQNHPPPLANRFNLFSPAHTIPAPASHSLHPTAKREIKLIFHHPNLLFLNPKKHNTKEQVSRKVETSLIQQRARTKHSSKSSNQLRPYTSYLESKGSRKHTAVNTPWDKRISKQQSLQVCGRSSGLGKAGVELLEVQGRKKSRQAFNLSVREENNQNVFRYLQSRRGGQKKAAWGQLMEANKHAVRLNMYLDVQKKFNKYINKCL